MVSGCVFYMLLSDLDVKGVPNYQSYRIKHLDFIENDKLEYLLASLWMKPPSEQREI